MPDIRSFFKPVAAKQPVAAPKQPVAAKQPVGAAPREIFTPPVEPVKTKRRRPDADAEDGASAAAAAPAQRAPAKAAAAPRASSAPAVTPLASFFKLKNKAAPAPLAARNSESAGAPEAAARAQPSVAARAEPAPAPTEQENRLEEPEAKDEESAMHVEQEQQEEQQEEHEEAKQEVDDATVDEQEEEEDEEQETEQVSEYEQLRLANIRRNEALLAQLGLNGGTAELAARLEKKHAPKRKRSAPKKPIEPAAPTRRSSRRAGGRFTEEGMAAAAEAAGRAEAAAEAEEDKEEELEVDYDDSSVVRYTCDAAETDSGAADGAAAAVVAPAAAAAAATTGRVVGFRRRAESGLDGLYDANLTRTYSMAISDRLLAAAGHQGRVSLFGIGDNAQEQEKGDPLLSWKAHKGLRTMMNFVLKMMNFKLKMMNCVLKCCILH